MIQKTKRSDEAPPQGQAPVLVVDDNANNLLLMGEVLAGAYAVRIARSGEQALTEAVRQPRPVLVLLDVMMPGMDGFEVIERLRANPATAGIPVIFVTARESHEDEERGLRLGAVDYVTKPINPAALLARVRTHAELKQAREVLGKHLSGHPRFAGHLAGQRLTMIVKAAPLHDIGKIGIRDAILLKPGRLDAEEFAVMRTHARIGAEAIDSALTEVAGEHGIDLAALTARSGAGLPGSGPLEFLWVAREIVIGHHEKWDGSGYPFGLAGEDIPVAARLMALADVYDALISRRVYKAPAPPAQVERIIVEGRGSHFDPAIVDAFLTCKDEFLAIAERYADPQGPAR